MREKLLSRLSSLERLFVFSLKKGEPSSARRELLEAVQETEAALEALSTKGKNLEEVYLTWLEAATLSPAEFAHRYGRTPSESRD